MCDCCSKPEKPVIIPPKPKAKKEAPEKETKAKGKD